MKRKTKIKQDVKVAPGYWIGRIVVKDKDGRIVSEAMQNHLFLLENHTWSFEMTRMR